ncbi:MAG: hypothetical protein HY760_02475 [Nitrospirae bacterium]|nr:hypothetical protein [Nitrospirota bacterium]
MPPAYTDPCPEFATDASGIDMATAGGCPIAASGNPADPQTAATGVDQLATILDDMLAKMYDTANPANSLTQQLDILFATNWSGNASSAINGSTTTGAGLYIDQTLDQDLVFNTGDITSYVGKAGSAGDGVINRLTQLFELDTNQAGPNGGNTEAAGQTACNTGEASCGNTYNQEPGFGHAQDADYIDQWVVGYAKDVASDGNGIVSSISSWFEMGTATNCGARCSHTYDAGHQAVVKAVEEIDAHPGN